MAYFIPVYKLHIHYPQILTFRPELIDRYFLKFICKLLFLGALI